jgi:hypothetical protein
MDESELTKTILTSFGAPGLLLAAGVYALRKLHAELTLSQERRVADAQAAAAQLLELVQQQHAHLDTLARAMEQSSDAMHSALGAALAAPPPAPPPPLPPPRTMPRAPTPTGKVR